jgi:hypothetical protein
MLAPATRRQFLVSAICVSAGVADVCLAAEGAPQHPQPKASPNAPTNQNVPEGLNNLPTEAPATRAPNTVNAVQVAEMVGQLYQMALDLKQETERTNLNTMLPADFLKRAEQIEKLAKKIRQTAKG